MTLFETCTVLFTFFLHLAILDFIEADKMIYFSIGSQGTKDWHIPMVQARARAIGKDLKYGWYNFPPTDQFRKEMIDVNNAGTRLEDDMDYVARQWIFGNGSRVPRRLAKVLSSNYTAFDLVQLMQKLHLIYCI